MKRQKKFKKSLISNLVLSYLFIFFLYHNQVLRKWNKSNLLPCWAKEVSTQLFWSIFYNYARTTSIYSKNILLDFLFSKRLGSTLSNDEIINPSDWMSLFCFQFFSKNLCIAWLRKYFLRKNGSKRSRPNDGVLVLPLLNILSWKSWNWF